MNSDVGVENKSKEGLLSSHGFICEELLYAELVESLEKQNYLIGLGFFHILASFLHGSPVPYKIDAIRSVHLVWLLLKKEFKQI